ncbi:MAG: 1-deoxy-D-xylulose-5-phosphate synthase [Clostridiaceae bacterium]|nr:1-deoxy-D-xylulose-5-phosphate synthase [Clostridiaceae bacterium]
MKIEIITTKRKGVIKLAGILDRINNPQDIKELNFSELDKLAAELREFLIEHVSETGGHIASNLGIVELTLALHKIFTTPDDKMIWDVGHQTYVHKIITGRKNNFNTLRKYDGLAGFPKTSESPHDFFNTGHSSTAISAALGFARARDLKKERYSVIAVVGDGALTGGMAFEALNDAGRSASDIIVVLNDNEMSIAKNVGGLSSYLSHIRSEPIYFKAKEDLDFILSKIPAIGKSASKMLSMAKGTIKYMILPGIIFEELGFKYLGPIDGHSIQKMADVFSRAKNMKGPIFIHVCTQKGKGYPFAEEKPDKYHGISPFEAETGEVKVNNGPCFSDVFGSELVKLAEENKDIVAITAAMPHGTGLNMFSERFPERFFDVGIAEQHAVTFAAGLASNGLKPVVATYSSFLQRAYDQILHDVSLQNLHVVLAVDRAGIVGEDGETHQGIYDICYMRHMPNITMLAPVDYTELASMLKYAVLEHKGPVAIRYPRGTGSVKISREIAEIHNEVVFDNAGNEKTIQGSSMMPVEYGKGVLLKEGKDLTMLSVGNMAGVSLKAAKKLETMGISVEVINPRFIKPMDEGLILDSCIKTGRIVTIEDGVVDGGFGSSILEMLNRKGITIGKCNTSTRKKQHGKCVEVKMLGFPNEPIPCGSRETLYKKYGLDVDSIVDTAIKLVYSSKAGNTGKADMQQ